MTLQEHQDKFGHTKYYKLKVVYPDGTPRIGDLYNACYLSEGTVQEADTVYQLGHYLESNLKSCPFCSGEASWYTHSYGVSGIHCMDCGISVHRSKSPLIEHWNKRTK